MIGYTPSQFHFHYLLMHLSLVITVTTAQFNGQASETDLWCVAKNNAEDSALQAAIDWACGPGGTDCAGIQQGGPCYDPSDIVKTASYVFNNYYLKNGPEDEACNFSNSAAVTSLNPSQGTCKLPSSKRVSNGNIVDAATTSTQGTTAQESSDFNRAGRIFSSIWSLPFIILGLVMINHHF
ncbi:PREDICTED: PLASMODESMATA CALLOSE-BINDING PROTEIN 5-like [Brassica oleracea var. oleracea]|uniref:X8 domain-containing protein n=1 Tax=Brassica oleracea var. oleracea TaxID=109376 RepID=A0A0D3BPB1_BRAOL|nr:PREDICTED: PLASMODESMATA CALLOSE-BINDING PROTEIN 5-like [Brassica oleracea var. oleracea]